MMRAHLWYVIGTGQGYRLDDEGVPLECPWLDDEGLIPVSHYYTSVVARLLEVLAGYAGRPNLTMITTGTVLERLRTRRIALSLR